ncbi:MAG: EF-hand domain-containing protein [Hyphomicrobiales bacterium]|nr:EF-hand domain-containing protein [Hyphomicrobiales bacterium]
MEVEMISTTRYLRLIPLLALPASSLAQAQNDRSGQRSAASAQDPIVASLPNWDFNHDGIFTCENWKKYMAQLFNRADRQKRGFITPQEFETIKTSDPMFANADFDYFDERKQGRISRSDFVDRPSPFFVRYDTKHTCRVARNEINATAPAASNPGHRRSGMGRRGFGF